MEQGAKRDSVIYGFYFRFLKLTGSKGASTLLAKLAYVLFFFRYLAERLTCKEKIVSLGHEDALRMVREVHPDEGCVAVAHPAPVDDSLDLSIIVPVYNYANLIETNIESILAQKTKYSFQLILVDDGSTDGAREILRSYEDHSNVRIIYQENQGIAAARNTGLDAATGKYVMFVDCDDKVEDSLVETLMSKAYEGDYDIVMCGHNLVKERNGKVFEVVPNVYPDTNLLAYAPEAEILNYAGLPWCKVYKRELWDEVRYLPGYWYEDSIIHSLIFTQCKKFAYVPTVCYQYRWYERNFSHVQGNSANHKCVDRYWMLIKILKRYEHMGLAKDVRFETMLIKHLSAHYYTTVADLGEASVEALFSLACDIYERYGVKDDCQLPYMLRATQRSLQQRDINFWKLATRYQR